MDAAVSGVRSPWKTAVLLAVLVAAAVGIWFGYNRYEHRFVRTNADLLALLPPEADLTTFYIDLAALRRVGLVNLFTGITPAPSEKDYRDFIAATGFDFARDLDTLAGAVNGRNDVFFLLRGRFDWPKLRAYAVAHGGHCDSDECRAPGSTARRWVSFIRVQSDAFALAIGARAAAADSLRPPGRRQEEEAPLNNPVWVRVAPALIKDPTGLPRPLQIFLLTLQSANSVMLSAGRAEHADEAFRVQLDAAFPNAASADTACKQLEWRTKALQRELANENRQPDAADLTGLLTAGAFQSGSTEVHGVWPVRKELLQALE